VFYFCNKTGLKADLPVQFRDRQWGAIKKQIEEPAKNLLKLKDKIDADKLLMVLY